MRDDTPVLLSAARTPVGRFTGVLRDTDAVDLGAHAVRSALARAGDPVPDQILLGNVVQAGNGQNPARVAAVRGGVPTTVPGITLNNVCLAGMTAAGMAATLVRTGEIDVGLVGGFESMSRALHGVQVRAAAKVGDGAMVDLLVRDGLWCALSEQGMGEMSDAATAQLGISRADQDAFALASHQRAAAATGRLAEEIVALPGLDHDEGVRPDSTIDRLARLRPAFTPDGTLTAGNSSQMSDAGSAGIVTSAGRAAALGVEPLAEIAGYAAVAGPDPTLHLKPAVAARDLLKRHGLSPGDVDLWEINEAFGAVVIATMRDLEIDHDRVNVNGGAIAIGHPLGGSGFRLVMTLAFEMRRRGAELGVAAICGGGGQGGALLLRRR
ncbi:acetyl-CoA C-acyltransferase [Pseudonocardia kunmingensis]|uniref:Probable acetyl-CoA acetyltransferase n=1 Tax=Pseudonocardia kunmingensis TaxID=630975 RepID=A0A543C231_9PSEU|nr:acetyl-CoA C-acyltransferase [Pseudonocardia kunmingensis]TQL91106.1 acetyl-CoA C-acetyltransferase [Pseudonocardia kunmingensis]